LSGEFNGKIAVVTGAARGIGRVIAQRNASEGATVIIIDLNSKELLKLYNALQERNAAVKKFICDVSDDERVHLVTESIIDEFGRIDILINCAGILYPTRFDSITVEEWDRVIAVNLRGVFLFMREIYPHMKKRGDGRIVNFASTAGLTVSTLGGAHYTVSKHGVVGITKAVAKEGGPFGVRVNAVCPGLIDTEMVRVNVNSDAVKKYEQSFPLRRIGTPEEVADLVLFLVSDRSSYITGTSINISGGDLLI